MHYIIGNWTAMSKRGNNENVLGTHLFRPFTDWATMRTVIHPPAPKHTHTHRVSLRFACQLYSMLAVARLFGTHLGAPKSNTEIKTSAYQPSDASIVWRECFSLHAFVSFFCALILFSSLPRQKVRSHVRCSAFGVHFSSHSTRNMKYQMRNEKVFSLNEQKLRFYALINGIFGMDEPSILHHGCYCRMVFVVFLPPPRLTDVLRLLGVVVDERWVEGERIVIAHDSSFRSFGLLPIAQFSLSTLRNRFETSNR